MAGNTIIQWNVRGIRSNFEDLSILIKSNPTLIALQETLITKDNFLIPNYNTIHNIHKTDVQGSLRGVSLSIRKDVLFQPITLATPLEAVAALVKLNKPISICSLYLSPSKTFSKQCLIELTDQLPQPFLILGDLNAHSPLWGSDDLDTRGKILEDWLSDLDLCVLNTGNHTFLSSSTGCKSHIDLSVCSSSIFLDFDWEVLNDLHGSDHFPIIIKETVTDGKEQKQAQFWKLKNANWPLYSKRANALFQKDFDWSVDNHLDLFTDLVIKAADIIPKSNKKCNKPKNFWFDEQCKILTRERKKAQRKVYNSPTVENLINYKQIRAKCRFTFKQKKKQSWKNFCSTLNKNCNIQKVWKVIRKIQNRQTSNSIRSLKINDSLISDGKEVANLLATTFEENSSSNHYSKNFQKIKNAKEKIPCFFKPSDSEIYNKPFTLYELTDALQKAKNTAVGPDSIHYQLLTHLPDPCLDILLKVFNEIWISGFFPPTWREAIIIPIPKPGKDHSDPNNYRPIALTSCICKTMERMVYERLMWQLEMLGALSPLQCGFRKNRSTVDHLIRFETYIRSAFSNKEHVVAVLFDIEKAYDTTWKYGILSDLKELGFDGYLPIFISNFLKNRIFRVRVGDVVSDYHEQEMGVPQGSILSPLLFNIKINNIVKNIKPNIAKSLFVDDFKICGKGKSLKSAERQVQLCINAVEKWVNENGFKFSVSKTECIHFHNKRTKQPDPNLNLYGNPIKSSSQVKFLGVIFDQKLTFLPHIKNLKTICQKRLDVLKVVSGTHWGADKDTLLCLYRALIRSKLDYACIVYGSAHQSYLRILDPIHHQGLRICLGAFRTSPKESLYAEANEPSLELRRQKLSLKYYIKLKANPENPAYDCVFDPPLISEFEVKTKIPTFGNRMSLKAKDANINIKDINDEPLATVSPPWSLAEPAIDITLSAFPKENTSTERYKQLFLELCQKHQNVIKIFTDGSKSANKVASAAVSGPNFNQVTQKRLIDECSIFTAELQGILLALDMVERSKGNSFFIISDSLSALKLLHSRKISHYMLTDIHDKHTHLKRNEMKNILFVWVPSHIGIKGNEVADRAAKAALDLPVSCNPTPTIPFSDIYCKVLTFTLNHWKKAWSEQRHNKLFQIMSELGNVKPPSKNRREDVVLSRLRIGHSFFTHSFILSRDDPPWCIPCDCLVTIKHILLECYDLHEIRIKHYNAVNMKSLFNQISTASILNFLKEINIFTKI